MRTLIRLSFLYTLLISCNNPDYSYKIEKIPELEDFAELYLDNVKVGRIELKEGRYNEILIEPSVNQIANLPLDSEFIYLDSSLTNKVYLKTIIGASKKNIGCNDTIILINIPTLKMLEKTLIIGDFLFVEEFDSILNSRNRLSDSLAKAIYSK